MIKALVFDFDGLILETETPIFQSWQELYRRHGREMPMEHWLKNIGTAEAVFDPLGELERSIGRIIDRSELPLRRQRELDLIAELSARPGVEDYLRSGRRLGLKIGLASSSTCGWVTSHLDRLGLIGYFDAIVAQDDVSRTKPDPELYLKAVSWLGVRPAEAVAFEDSLNGLRSAKQAGLYCVVAPTALTCDLPLGAADLRLESLACMSLEDVLAKLNGGPPA